MNTSFYGGRKGESFVIAARYKFIKATDIYTNDYYQNIINKECFQLSITKEEWIKRNCMVEAFQQGSNYEVVNYDEFVIIDSPHKNDTNNGKIFKRGYNYQDKETGGAIYVGQIVGPAGLSPQVTLSTITEIDKINQEKNPDFNYLYSKGVYNVKNSLVPGKVDGKEQYSDEIKWVSCSVRDKNDKDTIAYIGFTFPYLVIDYTATPVTPYETKKPSFEYIKRIDKKDHPYYEQWQLSVPKGIKGDAFKNFRVISASPQDGIQPYDGQVDDRNQKRKILVYDYYNFDDSAEGRRTSIYLGDFNMIQDIQVDDFGTISILYTHDNEKVFANKIKWINDISITQQGLFTINYNYGGEATKYQTNLKWIDKVSLDSNGTLKFIYNNGENFITYDKTLKWIVDANVDDNGTIKIDYNTAKEDAKIIKNKIKWITGVGLNPEGTLQVNYNNGTKPDTFEKKVKWIKSIELNPEGQLTFKYNTGEQETLPQNIKWISNLFLDEKGQLSITFNDKTSMILTQKIRWITGCTFDKTGAFNLTFNDGTSVEQQIDWVKDVSVSPTGEFKLTFNNPLKPDVIHQMDWVKDVSVSPTGEFKLDFISGKKDSVIRQVDWVKDINISDTGLFNLTFNNLNKPAVTRQMDWVDKITFDNNGNFKLKMVSDPEEKKVIKQHIRWIDDVSINTGNTEGTGNQKVHITYNDKSGVDIGQPVNYIMKMAIEPNTYHLLALYSDPQRREQLKKDHQNASFNNHDDWHDLGCIKNYDGILIGKNYSESFFGGSNPNIATIVNKLNLIYPSGLPANDKDLHGKIITVGNSLDDKRFFAFDYTKKQDGHYAGWYFLGSISNSVAQPGSFASFVQINAQQEEEIANPELRALAEKMPAYTMWFVIEE